MASRDSCAVGQVGHRNFPRLRVLADAAHHPAVYLVHGSPCQGRVEAVRLCGVLYAGPTLGPMGAGQPRVLIVDDDERVLRSLVRLMRRMPVQLVTATSAEVALEWIERDGPPSLLISDYQLGGMDGLSLLMRVRSEHPSVQLVLSSGTTRTPPPGSGIGELPKPVDVEELARLIGSLGAPSR